MLIALYAETLWRKNIRHVLIAHPVMVLKPTTACLLFGCSRSRQDRLDMQFDSCKQVLMASANLLGGV
jgi:hypothetical protein